MQEGKAALSTLDFIIALFCRIDDKLNEKHKRSNARLWHSELVTIALLWALKGGSSRAFYRWLKRDYLDLFPALPERSRLFQRIARQRDLAEQFEAEFSCLSIIDSFGIELIHPRREGRSEKQIGKKGLSNGRWIVGMKFCALINQWGQISDWDYESANVCDNTFNEVMVANHCSETGVYSDSGFRRSEKRGGNPDNLMICERGQHNERMLVETVFSLLTGVLHLKRLFQRAQDYLEARLGFTVAIYNMLVAWNGIQADKLGRTKLSIAEFAL